MDYLVPKNVQALREKTEKIVREVVAPKSDEVDQKAMWPEHSMRAFAKAGLLGLHVPKRLGGLGEGLMALAVLSEEIGKVDPSSALCFGMHNVGTAVMAAKPTKDQENRFLKKIAEGKHITTLALSEHGTGAEFYVPQTELKRDGKDFIVNGAKTFITNGSHADSYVISTKASPEAEAIGEFNCLVLEKDAEGLTWGAPWQGFGMRGNSSLGLTVKNASVPVANLLGEEGDQNWYVFEVVAPYFLIAMAGTYLGIAERALDEATNHLKERKHAHSGRKLAEIPVLQDSLADLWAEVQKTRLLIYQAGILGDAGDARALDYILMCKADVAKTAVHVVNEAMTLMGGMAYRENGIMARLLRDVRASHVMAPTTQILKSFTGRSLLGLPLI